MTKTAYELCEGFYNYLKDSGRKSSTLSEYAKRQRIKNKLYPSKFETVSSAELKVIRTALSSGHNICPKLKLYGYKKSANNTGVEAIYRLTE